MAKYSKADLKALMREKLAAKNRSKIDSPLAAYDSKGQLTCRVCLTHQKELTWTTHLLSQRHKEVSSLVNNFNLPNSSQITRVLRN